MIPTRSLHRRLVTLAVVTAAGLLGCNGQANTLANRPPRPVDFPDEIELTASPWGVNWDGIPGADGLVVRVRLYRVRGIKVELVPVKGALEFSLYEGKVSSDARGKAKPFRTWRFAGKELERFLARDGAGWGYTVPLGWGETGPATSSVTLTAQYVPPRGRAMPAERVILTMRPH